MKKGEEKEGLCPGSQNPLKYALNYMGVYFPLRAVCMQSSKSRQIVDRKKSHLSKKSNFVYFLEKYRKLRKNRWASTSHHMLFESKV